MKLISQIFYNFLVIIDKLFKFFLKKSILSWFKDFLHNDSYLKLNILSKKFFFLLPINLQSGELKLSL